MVWFAFNPLQVLRLLVHGMGVNDSNSHRNSCERALSPQHCRLYAYTRSRTHAFIAAPDRSHSTTESFTSHSYSLQSGKVCGNFLFNDIVVYVDRLSRGCSHCMSELMMILRSRPVLNSNPEFGTAAVTTSGQHSLLYAAR